MPRSARQWPKVRQRPYPVFTCGCKLERAAAGSDEPRKLNRTTMHREGRQGSVLHLFWQAASSASAPMRGATCWPTSRVGEKPGMRKVDFHGIPFFAITHRSGISPRREFADLVRGVLGPARGERMAARPPPQPPARARAAREGGLHVQRARVGGVCRRRLREDRPGRARHARHGGRPRASTSDGSARSCSRPRCSTRGATSIRTAKWAAWTSRGVEDRNGGAGVR